MRLPRQRIGPWARELIEQCSSSMSDRIQRGAVYKNLYLTGDENSNPATYPKSFAFIDNLSSYLYSPVDLRWGVEFYGPSAHVDEVKAHAIAAELHKHVRRNNIDTKIEEAVSWSLVKGKVHVKLLWTTSGIQSYLIQPELMGVLQENISDLDEQEAFFQRMYLTRHQLNRILREHPDRTELTRKAQRYMSKGMAERPEDTSTMRQIILGGMYPYQAAGGPTKPNRGLVDWMNAPAPRFSPEVLASLIPMDELWVWNDDVDDWATIQLIGDDCVLEGKDVYRNIFAQDQFTDPKMHKKDTKNPLKGKHPFQEVCANRLDGYYWGMSELQHVALLQKSLNSRLDGINAMLRLQERPPKAFLGMSAPTPATLAKLNKPAGWFADTSPNGKIQDMAPKVPEDMYVSLHEIEKMFDDMAGFAPVLQGRGESGVRAQGHAETLVRTASPRFKDRALLIERQVEGIGGLALDMLKSHVGDTLVAWVNPQDGGIEAEMTHPNPGDVPPIKGQRPIEFLIYDFPENAKVVVDSHTSSPAFSHETRELLFALAKLGVIGPEQLISHTHPPGEDSMLTDVARAKAEKAAFLAEHPELAIMEQHRGKRK